MSTIIFCRCRLLNLAHAGSGLSHSKRAREDHDIQLQRTPDMSVNVSGNGSNSKHQRLSTAQTAQAVGSINAQPVLVSRQSGCLVRVSCLIARMTLLRTHNCIQHYLMQRGCSLKYALTCDVVMLSLLHCFVLGHKA